MLHSKLIKLSALFDRTSGIVLIGNARGALITAVKMPQLRAKLERRHSKTPKG